MKQGEESTAQFYSYDPLRTAEGFFENGATLLHIVDLNAALHNDSRANKAIIDDILSELGEDHSLQLAGGIRSGETAEDFLSKGAERIVLGSLAYRDLNLARQILEKHGDKRIILALDYDAQGKIRTGGWKDQKNEKVDEALERFSQEGFTSFLLTSTKQDGMLSGPDYETLSRVRKLCSGFNMKIIASGGVTSIDDLEELERLKIDEAIIGRAIYEHRISDLRSVFGRFR